MAAPTKLEIRHELEWRACKASLLYFVENYWNVATVGEGYAIMQPWDYQRLELQKFQDACDGTAKARQNRLKARQLGWTTIAGVGAFWSAFFYEHRPWLFAAQGEDDAVKTLTTKVKVPYNMLPKWLRDKGPQVEAWNNEVVEFDNGSSITSIPSTSSSGRGQAIFGAIMDEAAFMENADELFAAIDPMCYGPLFLFSTANGMGNFFHEMWVESQLPDSEWEGSFWPWHVRPGRDQSWYDKTKRKYRTRPHLFYQEFPSTPEEAFTRSGRVALPMDTLRDTQHWCDPDFRYDLSLIKGHWQDADKHMYDGLLKSALLEGEQWADLELHVWEKPFLERGEQGQLIRDPNYVVSVDVAEGLDHGDYSAISVTDVNNMEQVATVRARVPIEDLAEYAEFIGYWYYVGLIAVERNNAGIYPIAQLQERAYPRLYRMDSLAQQKRGDRTPRYGWYTSRATKPFLVTNFSAVIVGETMQFHDRRLLVEAGTFLADGKGGYGARPPNHDDLLMATGIGLAVGDEVGAYPPAFVDPEPGPATMGEVFGLMKKKTETDEAAGTALSGGIGQKAGDDVAEIIKSFEVAG